MKYRREEIKEGIKFHFIKTDRYKTDLTYITLMVPIKRETITHNALIPLMLKRGCATYKNQYELSKVLDNLYGTTFSASLDKKGDNMVIKFTLDSLNNNYSLDDLNITKEGLNVIFDIIFNPLFVDNKFRKDYLEVEKDHLKTIINSKIDDKESYATDACLAIMYGEEGYGAYKFGYVEDLDNIDVSNLTDYYNWLINTAKIDIFISSQGDYEEIKSYVVENENIKKLKPRKNPFVKFDDVKTAREVLEKPRVIIENMNVTQGKLVIGYDVRPKQEEFQEICMVYNALLGGSANSLLFQNVREKEGLCYSTRSIFVSSKLGLFIKCGIQIENYDKALELINKQVDMLKEGDFSDEDLENSKAYIVSLLRNSLEDQDAEMCFYVGCELSQIYKPIEEYMDCVQKVTKEEVISIANSVFVNTIYFLKNADEE